MSTTDAGQRDRIIRSAKFPKKIPVAAYGHARNAIQRFWNSGRSLEDHFEAPLDKLRRIARNEADRRDEALRCISAIDRFKALYAAKRWPNLKFEGGPVDLAFKRQNVTINTRLDCQLYRTIGDETVTGGIVMFYGNTPDSRKNIDERRKQVASLIRWSLEENGQIDPLPSLCLSMDIFGDVATKAPEAKDRFRETVDRSCREAALKWDSIEPPSGYDGPDWH